jgi:hypothetical protein
MHIRYFCRNHFVTPILKPRTTEPIVLTANAVAGESVRGRKNLSPCIPDIIISVLGEMLIQPVQRPYRMVIRPPRISGIISMMP